ncbi:DUF5666 domain-containing protein [Vibrio gangliei]|uniref:DUF5666 domain-containing protein n=1 Tax=Vibrio gangliei TaxID=2077090 RepID=UPI000D018070|nr:DUF5666 domain-containing protein [Vibrio gangliei]
MKKTLLCLSMAALLSACGGSSSDDSNSSNGAATPTKLNGVASAVSDTQITVNEYTLDAQNAEVSYDDITWSLQDIQVGMRLEVETNRRGTAEEIDIEPNLVGEISDVNADSIVVNGITVSTANINTAFTQGDWVFVNGFFDANNTWQTDGVFIVNGVNQAEIEGTVSQASDSRFFIGATEVDFASVAVDDGRAPVNGDWVEVEGYMQGAVFIATEVEVENDDRYSDMELEGTITWVNNEKSVIELNGRTTVAITATTRFEDGVQSDLIEGAQVDAELLNGDSGLEATEIDFENGSGSQNTSVVSNKFALTGTATYIDATHFSINGFEFVVNANTHFENGLSLDSLSGVEIEVEGIEQTNGTETIYLVKEIEEIEINDNDIDLQGKMTDGTIWAYVATDASLDAYTDGDRIDVECQLVTMNSSVSSCRIDN